MRVVCAMSGGVDSSVAAALMVQSGHEVIGLTMRLYDAKPSSKRGRGGSCCSPAEVDLARRACEILGIPHYIVDERESFQQHVIDDFAREYSAGRTPNPCVRCNEFVKFAPLLGRARSFGAPYLVTGHYARNINGQLFRAKDSSKDQSYFLFAMGRENLNSVQFPLGDWSKTEARKFARNQNLPNADVPDSQELCFVSDGDHARVVESRAQSIGLDPKKLQSGSIRDEQGRVIGQHDGVHHVTIGQRKGLRISGTKAKYVLRVLPQENAIVVGDASSLYTSFLHIGDFRRLSELEPSTQLRGTVQIRHRGVPIPAVVRLEGSDAWVEFDDPVRAAAPGQAAVLYKGDQVLGGGWIREVSRLSP